MKKANKLLNLLIKYTENVYKIMQSMKENMKVYVIFLLNFWKKQSTKLFNKKEH